MNIKVSALDSAIRYADARAKRERCEIRVWHVARAFGRDSTFHVQWANDEAPFGATLAYVARP